VQFFVRFESAGCDADHLLVVFNDDGFEVSVVGAACIQNADAILVEKLDSFEALVEFLGLEQADEADLVVFGLNFGGALFGCAELTLQPVLERNVPAVLIEIHRKCLNFESWQVFKL